MFDESTLGASDEAEAAWHEEYLRIGSRFEAPINGASETHSGLPIKPCYFPRDLEHISFSEIGAPGAYPFTRGNLAVQYQFMNWANQPVIGYGLPEHTRERMDLLA